MMISYVMYKYNNDRTYGVLFRVFGYDDSDESYNKAMDWAEAAELDPESNPYFDEPDYANSYAVSDGGWFDDIPDFYKYLRRFHPTVEWVVCAE